MMPTRMSNNQRPSNQRLSALEKALAVLEAVSDQPQAIGLPDLAARLKLPRQTVHRVLGQLEDAKLVLRDPSRERYSIGPRQSRLAFLTLWSKNQGAPVRARKRNRERFACSPDADTFIEFICADVLFLAELPGGIQLLPKPSRSAPISLPLPRGRSAMFIP